MGAYPTREAAEHWRERAEERNASWDAADRDWEAGGASLPDDRPDAGNA